MNEGYCENGIHYIGDNDECPRCELVEQMRKEEREANNAE